MNPLLKDIIQVASWGVAILGGLIAALGGLIAAFVAIRQLKLNTEQRKNELRWMQANAAKEIINDIHSNNWSKNAVTMLDLSEGKPHLKFEEKGIFEISYESGVIPALKNHRASVQP